MPKSRKLTNTRVTQLSREPAALAGEYLRSFASSLSSFGEFDMFLESLKSLVGSDLYLDGSAQLVDPFSGQASVPDFENLEPSETVISVAGQGGSSGYLKYTGRQDLQPFGAEDLHLLGAISGLIASLVQQAHHFRQKSRAEQVLQYLINQLPLGVVCFDLQGQVIVESKLAKRLLGEGGAALVQAELLSRANRSGRVQMHFEIEGRFIYSEARSMEVAEGVAITACVLYDLSAYRSKLLVELEKEAYRSESRGVPVSVVVLESRAAAGQIYAKAKASASRLQLDPRHIQPLDAYRCAMIFEGKRLRSVRYLLKQELSGYLDAELLVSVVGYEAKLGEDSPAEALLNQAIEALRPVGEALRPKLIVMDAYPAVIESLDIILSEDCQLSVETEVEVAAERIRSGEIDGVFFDLDGYSMEVLATLRDAAKEAGGGFKFFYCTCKRRGMLDAAYRFSSKDVILQKPFDAAVVTESVELQFNLA